MFLAIVPWQGGRKVLDFPGRQTWLMLTGEERNSSYEHSLILDSTLKNPMSKIA